MRRTLFLFGMGLSMSVNAAVCSVRDVGELSLMHEAELREEFCTQAVREMYNSSAYDRSVRYPTTGRVGDAEKYRSELSVCRHAVSNLMLVYRDKFGSDLDISRCN